MPLLSSLQQECIKQEPEDLEWAKKTYKWQKSHLVDPVTRLVWDGVNRTGNQEIDKDWRFSYNQGVFIGAASVLFELTQDKQYLEDAIKTFGFVVSDNNLAPAGILKSEGYGDGGLFKGILIRYMVPMIKSPDVQEERKVAYYCFIRENAISVYKNMRRPEMLIGASWTKESEKIIDASAQLTGLMLLEAMANLEKP